MIPSYRGVAAALGVLVVAGVCVRLGFWQLDRLEQRRAFNSAVAEARALPPLELDSESLAAIREHPSEFLYRRAVASGIYDSHFEVLLRGRAYQGRPGVHLVTLLQLTGTDAVILVNRGWIPSPDAATVDPRPYRHSRPRRVRGILHTVPISPADASPALIDLGDTLIASYRRLDHSTLSRSFVDPLPLLYLEELPDTSPAADLPLAIPPSALDEGPHLGYAVQWFSFAAIAIIGLAVVARRTSSPG